MIYSHDIAIRYERESRWKEAARIWRGMGCHISADACEMIAMAIERGDRFRARVKQMLHDAGLPEMINPCAAYDNILRAAHNEIYG